MAFRFVSGKGTVADPAAVMMYASGVVHPGGVVLFDAATSAVSPATATGATTTNIFGVSLDYAQGASDTQVRVIPFAPGQLWEADCANAISTANILLRHTLATDTVLRNVVTLSETASTGIFLVYNVVGSTSGSGKVVGTFLQRSATKSDHFALT